MFVRPFGAPPAARFLTFRSLLRCTILLAVLLPIDARGAEEEEDEIPAPEDIELKTSDGLELHATFFPGTQEKKSVPIILLHAYKGSRQDFDGLATMLQKQGHAVIAPDLRGHGDSVDIQIPGGKKEKLEARTLRPIDFENMVRFDVETIKTFLREKNNEGELNIDKLCVVGAEMGAAVGAIWAAQDWNWAPLATGKQGQDVKGLVMISPDRKSFHGLRLMDAVGSSAIRSELAILLIAGGKKAPAKTEVVQLYSSFEKYHVGKEDLFKFLPSTTLQSTKLLTERGLGVDQEISKFVARLVRLPFPWAERKNPLQ